MPFHSTSFHCNIDEEKKKKKNCFPAGTTVMLDLHLCGFSLGTLDFSPVAQMCTSSSLASKVSQCVVCYCALRQ